MDCSAFCGMKKVVPGFDLIFDWLPDFLGGFDLSPDGYDNEYSYVMCTHSVRAYTSRRT